MQTTVAPAQFAWAGRVAAGRASVLGPVRLVPGLQAAEADGAVWVRGPQLEREAEAAVARVPWESRYELLEDAQLRRAGRLLPEGRLPETIWTALPDFLKARLALVAAPGSPPPGIAIELHADNEMREATLLECSAREWLQWVEGAAQIRLERLEFALDSARAEVVLVRGTPLPPLAGTRFVEREGIAMPAGRTWWPAVGPETLRTALGAEKSELALLRAGVICTRIPRSAWISATRAAVRLLLKGEAR